MINLYLIGYGKWGKKIHTALKKCKFRLKIQIKKNRLDKKNINFDCIDWVFIATNTNQHYRLVKKFLNKKINVFCEKPLTKSLSKNKELFKLAKKNKCKLYVSDVENYKNIKLNLRQTNYIIRTKPSENKKDILNRLAYHDFTYIYNKIKNKKIQKTKILSKKKGEFTFMVKLDDKFFYFDYNLNLKKKLHTFNKKNLRTKKNPLKDMITKVINFKVNYEHNKNISIFTNSLINTIKKKS